MLRQIVESHDLASLNRVLDSTYLDLTVPTDERPFFFNQLRIFDLRSFIAALPNLKDHIGGGVWLGNLLASAVLVLILFITIIAVIATILIPLRSAARACSPPLVLAGSLYFSSIGMGFMLAEIALLQYFSVYLGHPTYSLSVCLFSLILASGLGSLTSDRLKLNTRGKLLIWGCLVAAYLTAMQQVLPSLFQATTDRERSVRIAISVAAIFPLGYLLGFAFPTGMRLVSAIDTQPTPWFWGINGATGVLASVLGVIFSMSFGIHVTLLIAAGCYLLVIPTGFLLLALPSLRSRPARIERCYNLHMIHEGRTERLLLRPLEIGDGAQIQQHFPHWEIVRYLPNQVPWPYPADGAIHFCRDVALPKMERGEEWHWTLRLRSAPEQLIGHLNLMKGEKDNRAFWLGAAWRGQGLMSEACVWANDFWFDTLGFPKLRATKAAANTASRRISERQGMRLMGVIEKDYVCGRLPSEVWEITAEEWRAWKARRDLLD